MKVSRRRLLLDVISTSGLIAASASIVWAMTMQRAPWGSVPAAGSNTYQPGETFASVSGLDFSHNKNTLVLWMRSGCRYCTESMDFYQRVVAAPRRQTRVVAMGAEAAAVLEAYLASHNVKVDQVLSVPQSDVKLPVTPIVVLVKADSKVSRVWRGKVSSASEQQDVLKTLE